MTQPTPPDSERDKQAAEKLLDILLVATEPTMIGPDECEALVLEAFAAHRKAAIEECLDKVIGSNADLCLGPVAAYQTCIKAIRALAEDKTNE